MDNGITKVNVHTGLNIAGKLVRLLYKDMEYYVDYKINDGRIFTYRFIPSIAKNGLWINPFIQFFNPKIPPLEVTQIRLRTNDMIGEKEEVKLTWEYYPFTKNNQQLVVYE